MTSAIRPRTVAVAALRRGDEILVFEATDPSTGERFHRMLGGGVAFGESGRDAVVRELSEELSAELVDVRWLGAVENIFGHADRQGHEIVLVYDARFADTALYDQAELVVTEETETLVARWIPLAELDGGGPPLYPAGVRSLLDGASQPGGPPSAASSSVPVVDKVVAYIVEDGRLLAFAHDEDDPLAQSGLQVPAGTVPPGEPLEQAVLREATEETGLSGLTVDRYLGMADYDMRPTRAEVSRRHFFVLRVRTSPPEEWAHHARPEGEAFLFRWLPIQHAHVVAGGFGAMLSAIPGAYLKRDA